MQHSLHRRGSPFTFLGLASPRKAPQNTFPAGAGLVPHSAAAAVPQASSHRSSHTDTAAAARGTTSYMLSTQAHSVGQRWGSLPAPAQHCVDSRPLIPGKSSGAYLSELPWLRREASRCWSPHPAAYTAPRSGNQDKNKRCLRYPAFDAPVQPQRALGGDSWLC